MGVSTDALLVYGYVWDEEADLDAWAWHAARTAVKAEYGVEISQHGSDQWSCPVVQIAGAGHRAYRGDVHALTADSLAIDPEWDGKLQRFVTDLGISTDEAKGPGWFLLSWWG